MNESTWLDTAGFMPHGHCFLWTPSLLAMHAASDLLIGLAYLAIPFLLFALLRQRPDLPFRPLFTAFSAFIALCGVTHLVSVWNIWHAEYWIEGFAKTATALASVPTAWALWRAVPSILALPSMTQLAASQRELAESNRELEAFVTTAAHDLQSPLQGLRMAVAAHARAAHPGASDRTDLDEIMQALEQMSAVVMARLQLARIVREPMRRSAVDLSKLAATAFRQLTAAHPDRDVNFAVEPDLVVQGDPGLLSILVENLIGNAWKFTAERSDAEIKVEGRRSEETSELIFVVRDNGAGFDMADATRLFQPLVRLHDQTRFPGQGIGLATVRRVVERHDGSIRIESQAGMGTTASITLPMPALRRAAAARLLASAA